MNFVYQEYKSPVGLLYLVARENKIQAIVFKCNWLNFKDKFELLEKRETPLLKETKNQLDQYFAGKRKSFNLPLELFGTEFQKRAWKALLKIPAGQTRSYKQQAQLVKAPKASRAVGSANKANPICIVLPCHRVISSNGSLADFAGGLKVKKFLLELEGAI